MNPKTKCCGNCRFSFSCEPADDGTPQVKCVMGGRITGPYKEKTRPCFAFANKNVRYNVFESRLNKPEPEEEKEEKVKVIRDDTVWTDEMDAKLKDMYYAFYVISDIAKILNIDKVFVVNRIRKLDLKRISAKEAKVTPSQANQSTPIPQQKYPNVKCCKGQCCKYKESCQHHLHWLEMGKPVTGLINSVTSCINYKYGKSNSFSEQVFFLYLGINGETTPDPLTFAETC